MKAHGIRGALENVRSSNGTAQHIACAICGSIMAGMFINLVGVYLVIAWAVMSFLVLIATVWLPRILLQYTLLADFFLSMIVLFQYVLVEDRSPPIPVYHVMRADGTMIGHTRGIDGMTLIDQVAHASALIWLAGWSLFLANLVHRQILENKRFKHEH